MLALDRLAVSFAGGLLCLGSLLVVREIRDDLLAPDRTHPSSSQPKLTKGARLPGIDLNRAQGRTLVLAIQRSCVYCALSMPFYHALADEVRTKRNLRFVAVTADDPGLMRSYLNDRGVPIEIKRVASLADFGIAATPTLVLLGKKAEVENTWFGLLNDKQKQEVLAVR